MDFGYVFLFADIMGIVGIALFSTITSLLELNRKALRGRDLEEEEIDYLTSRHQMLYRMAAFLFVFGVIVLLIAAIGSWALCFDVIRSIPAAS